MRIHRLHHSAHGTSDRGRVPGERRSVTPVGLIGRVIAFSAAAVVLISGLFISAVVVSALLVAGVIGGGWFWWKTRDLRKQLRAHSAQGRQRPRDATGDVLEGDYVREARRGAAVEPDAPRRQRPD